MQEREKKQTQGTSLDEITDKKGGSLMNWHLITAWLA